MPSDSPYDKFEKIKEANSELFAAIISKPKSPCKVHFDQNIVTHSVEYDDALEESVLTGNLCALFLKVLFTTKQ